MESVWQDFRSALRLLIKHPGLALVAVGMAAVGIGATTAAFSLINGVLFRPLPFPDSDRLVQVFRELPTGDRTLPISSADYINWRDQATSLEALGVYNAQDYEVSFDPDSETDQMPGAQVNDSFFETLGVRMFIGRSFTVQEAQGAEPVVVISHSLWLSRFSRNPDILGNRIWINQTPHEIIGVLPHDMEYPVSEDFYTPREFQPRRVSTGPDGQRRVHMMIMLLNTVARLKPGVTIEQATAELDEKADQRVRLISGQRPRLVVRPLEEHIVGRFRAGLWLVGGAVGFLLLVACANVANLLLSRAVERRREAALRLALGASRSRLVRQLLAESLLLAAFAGVAGVAIAHLGIRLLLSATPIEIPRSANIGIDLTVLAFALAAALLTGILFGLAPALEASRQDLVQTLKGAGAKAGGGLRLARGNRMRLGLVTAEVAFCMVLLVGAGLLANSFLKLVALDPGFNPRNLLLVQARPRMTGQMDINSLAGGYDQLLEALRAVPGIRGAATASAVPPTEGLQRTPFAIPGQSYTDDSDRPTALSMQVSDGYFETMGIRLLRGRVFTEADLNGPKVAVVNESALRYLQGEVLGQQVVVNENPYEIVGIVADVYQAGPQIDPEPAIYTPARSGMIRIESGQNVRIIMRQMSILVRTTNDPFEMTAILQNEVEGAGMTMQGVQSVEDSMWQSVAQPRFYASLFGVFAVTGLLLAAVGIFGVISYAVSQSTREIGIRMALGADRSRIITTVIRQGLTITLAGVVAGIGSALLLTRFMESLLVRVATSDPVTLIAVTALFMVVAALACYVPARRATTVDLMSALRYE